MWESNLWPVETQRAPCNSQLRKIRVLQGQPPVSQRKHRPSEVSAELCGDGSSVLRACFSSVERLIVVQSVQRYEGSYLRKVQVKQQTVRSQKCQISELTAGLSSTESKLVLKQEN